MYWPGFSYSNTSSDRRQANSSPDDMMNMMTSTSGKSSATSTPTPPPQPISSYQYSQPQQASSFVGGTYLPDFTLNNAAIQAANVYFMNANNHCHANYESDSIDLNDPSSNSDLSEAKMDDFTCEYCKKACKRDESLNDGRFCEKCLNKFCLR